MELEWLQDFICLANTGSFSHASEHRNISQSAFSRRIQALENWIGAELVDRHTHPVVLTEAGQKDPSRVLQVNELRSEDAGRGVDLPGMSFRGALHARVDTAERRYSANRHGERGIPPAGCVEHGHPRGRLPQLANGVGGCLRSDCLTSPSFVSVFYGFFFDLLL